MGKINEQDRVGGIRDEVKGKISADRNENKETKKYWILNITAES